MSSCPALKGGAIEAALLHGTSAANADIIAKQGFNERFTKRALYGKCVYLTIDTCKACRLASLRSTCAKQRLGRLKTDPAIAADLPPKVEQTHDLLFD